MTGNQKKRKKSLKAPWLVYYGLGQAMMKSKIKNHQFIVHNEATKHIQPPFIALGNHQGRWDWAYGTMALMPHMVRVVVTKYQLFRPEGKLITLAKAIPKSQFAPDPGAVLEILRTIRGGGAVLMYPAGRLSEFGDDFKPFPGTYELIKKLNVPVIMLQLDGGYRTGPRYNHGLNIKGPVVLTTSVLFTPEELQSLSEEEAVKRLDGAFCHDDFDSPNQGEYECENLIEGLEELLYICPACKSDFTMKTTADQTIKCGECGFAATMDARFRLKGENGAVCPATITAWGNLIRAEERRRADENPDYFIRTEMKLCEHVHKKEMFTPIGTVEGVCNKNGFFLKGDRNGEPFERHYSCEEYPAITYMEKVDILLPDNERVVCARLGTAGKAIQFAVVSEMFSIKEKEAKAQRQAPV